jgi:DNA-directed RNA polymerase subunit RPC12/RpoP
MAKHICCPQCGNTELQVLNETNVETTGKNYSASKGCLGYLMFGPLGVLCGSCGKGQQTKTTNTTYWTCPKCGKKFRTPEDIRKDKELNKKTFIALAIVGVLMPLFVLYSFQKQLAVGIPFAIIMCILIELFGFALTKHRNNKIENEAKQLEEDMERFFNK